MAATTTPSMNSVVKQLASNYTEYSFVAGERFAWNPVANTVYYEPEGSLARLLHELGHGLLQHEVYDRDVELLKMEADAWKKAREISPAYGVSLTEDDIENHMDSYRDWLHSRSTCPNCEATGVQSDANHYRCLECNASWRVNEARTCGLKRYIEQKNTP